MRVCARWPAVGLVLMLACAQAGAQQRPAIPAGGQTDLSRYLAAAVDRGDVPGVVALVVGPDGVLYEGIAGKQDVARRVEMKSDAIFRIASMTKPITTVALMMLVEAGKLSVDDPVSKFLPSFKDRPVLSSFDASTGAYQTRPAKRAVTIRHLLTHTSGVGYGWSSPVVARLIGNDRDKETELPLLHEPGEKWTYGASTRALGRVVEEISGQPLDVFLAGRILEPLGMNDTSFAVPAGKVSRVATVHARAGARLAEQPNAPVQQAPVRGDGGLYSTAKDYGIFLQMLLNGGTLHGTRILSERSVRTMGENQIGSVVVEEQPAADASRSRPYPLGAGRDTFGFGFQIAAPDDRYAGFRSAGSLSWAGIDNTHFWIDPTRRVAAVLLTQVLPFYDEACIGTLRGFEKLVYQHLR
jgi:CubicO group peptidase (beta-lactamase class C family)